MPEISPSAIVGRALQIYRDQAGTLIPAALIVFAIELLLALLVPGFFVVPLLAALVVGVFYQGMVVNLVRDLQDGRRDSSLGELFASVAPVLLPLIGLAFVAGIGIAIGFVLLIVPGLFLLTIWSVAAPVIVIERAGVFSALGRSRRLVRGNGWPVFGVIMLVFLINVAVNIVAALIGAPLGDAGRSIVDWIASTLTAPIVALTASVLYFALAGAAAPEPDPPYAGDPQAPA
jgi:hypothetical protein